MRRSILLSVLLFAAACRQQASPPVVATAASYAGSASCGTCHAGQAREWRASHHRQAMQRPTDDTVLGDFADAGFDYFDTHSRFLMRGDEFVVATSDVAGDPREFTVAYTFGVEPLQQYLVATPGGRLQALPYAWDSRPAAAGGQRWFHLYADEHIRPGDELHWTGRNHNWNYMCAECHSTDVKLGYDAVNDRFDTQYAEASVGCEACHGPGSTHIAQAEADDFDADSGLAVDLDDQGNARWIIDTKTGMASRRGAAGRRQQPETCGRCHARRGTIAPDYDHGRPLSDTHMPALLEESLYFADGQIEDEVYVYGSFLQSRMYRAGVTCTNCHNPHSGKLVSGPGPNAVCAQCHLPDRFATSEHSGHALSAAGCVDCHMPERTYMTVDDRRDHSFRIPRPDLSAAIATPNACNGCHRDESTAWAVDGFRRLFGEERLATAHYGRTLAAGRAGYANDGITALLADPETPAIVSATALTLLKPPLDTGDSKQLQAALRHADPLVRIGALRALSLLPAGPGLEHGKALLDDPVRGVRSEAALALAEFQDILPYADQQAFTRAAAEYRLALQTTANRPESLAALGSFDVMTGRPDSAERLFRRALQREPRFAGARLNLADLQRQSQDETGAGDLLREGLDLDADNAALRHAYGLHLVRASRPEDGLRELERAAALAPGNSRYQYVLGVALNSLGRADEALALLRQARSDFPADFDIGWALATMLRDRGETGAALTVARELAGRFPEDPAIKALIVSLDGNR